MALIENVLLRDPVNIEARLLQSQVLFAKGDVQKATESLENLDTNFSKVPAIEYQRARAYLKDDNTAQATALLNQAIAINPDYAEAILLLGEVHLRKRDAQPVVSSMLDLLKRRQDLVQAQIRLAQAHQTLGRLDDATAVFKKQIENSPQDAQPRLPLGLVFRERNKMDEARRAFEDAQRLAAENLLVVSQLIDLDIQTKDLTPASESQRTFVGLGATRRIGRRCTGISTFLVPSAAANRRLLQWVLPSYTMSLKAEGLVINHKRTEGIYCEEGLSLPRKKLPALARVPLPQPERPNQRWSMDFIHDQLSSGRQFRCLTIVDDFTRQCLAIQVDTSIGGATVVNVLQKLALTRPLPR